MVKGAIDDPQQHCNERFITFNSKVQLNYLKAIRKGTQSSSTSLNRYFSISVCIMSKTMLEVDIAAQASIELDFMTADSIRDLQFSFLLVPTMPNSSPLGSIVYYCITFYTWCS